jgi:hypothetical protein
MSDRRCPAASSLNVTITERKLVPVVEVWISGLNLWL